MFARLFTTAQDDRTATLLRVTLGLVMAAHGAQKLLGWFGGYGPGATIGFFAQQLGMPAAFTVLVIVAECFGGLGLALGLLTRVGAAGIAAVMVGAVALVHGKVGFFMNWSGQLQGEGFEYHLLAIAIAAALIVRGGGWASLDAVIARRLGPARPLSAAQGVPEQRRRAA